MAKQFPLTLVLRAVDGITGPLRAVRTQIERAATPVRAISNAVATVGQVGGWNELSAAAGRASAAVGAVNGALRQTVGRVAALTAGAAGGLYLFKRQFVDTAAMFEDLQLSLEVIEGSAGAAKRSMAFIEQMAVKTPFELSEIADAFRLMRNADMDPTNGSLQAIVDQVSKIAGSGEALQGVVTAITQMHGAGRINAQDANQLIQRQVPVWALLQRAVERVNGGQKVTIAQLRKMSEQGQLGASAVREVIRQMGIESAGAAARMMTSWHGLTSNLADQWTVFKKAVMASGPMADLKARVSGLLDALSRMADSGGLEELAQLLGRQIVDGLNQLSAVIVGDVLPAAAQLWSWVRRLSEAFGGWGRLLKLGIGAYIGGPLLVALAQLSAAVVSLGVAIGLTPLGWFLAAVAAIAAAALLIRGEWGDIGPFFEKLWRDVQASFEGFRGFVQAFGAAVDGDLAGMLKAFTKVQSAAEAVDRVLNFFQRTPGAKSGQMFGLRGLVDVAKNGAGPLPSLPARPAVAAAEPFRPAARPQSFADLVTVMQRAFAANKGRLEVDFKNVPRAVMVKPQGPVDLNLSLGYAMRESY